VAVRVPVVAVGVARCGAIQHHVCPGAHGTLMQTRCLSECAGAALIAVAVTAASKTATSASITRLVPRLDMNQPPSRETHENARSWRDRLRLRAPPGRLADSGS
jgi:hypothetical protein